MTLSDMAEIMEYIEIAYPRYYANKTAEEKKQAVKLWANMLSDYSKQEVGMAVKSYIAIGKFPPTVADIIERIQSMTNPVAMTEIEAWGYVEKALRNSTYNSKAEFEKLPDEVKSVLGSPEQLRSWAMLDADEVKTVISSNFQRSFRARAKEKKEYDKLPGQVREYANRLSETLDMKRIGD